MKISSNKLLKILVFVLAILLIVSSLINIYQLQLIKKIVLKDNLLNDYDINVTNPQYQLLSPDVAWLSADAFVAKQKYLTTNYAPLKSNLLLLLSNANGHYALYFEDLNTGAWIGINEKEEFLPFSLLKVPTLIAALKEVELGKVSFDTPITLSSEDINSGSGTLWQKGAGYTITVKDLMVEMIKHSDNTALLALNRAVVSDDIFIESRRAMGLPVPVMNLTQLNAKQYSNILRGLYFSNYLRRPFSELALTLMLETDFNSQIPAGVPSNIKVAHKVGFYKIEGIYHDCGIIYAPNNPYILCIMSKDTTSEESDRLMSTVSKVVYDYVLSKGNYTVTN